LPDFPNYICLQESLQSDEGLGKYFLIEKSGKKFALLGKPSSKESRQEFELLEKFKENDLVLKVYEQKLIKNNLISVVDFPENLSMVKALAKKEFLGDFEKKRNFVLRLCEGVLQIHQKGFVLSDLNLDNVWVNRDFEPVVVNLSQTVTADSVDYVRGHIDFMSPEMFDLFFQSKKLRYTSTIDIFATGVLYYYIVTGNFPFHQHFSDLSQLSLVHFQPSTRKDFIEAIHQTVIRMDKRIQLADLIELLKVQKAKQDSSTTDEALFYTFNSPELKPLTNINKVLLVGIMILLILFSIFFLLFLLRCMFKGVFYICCPWLSPKKKSKELTLVTVK
jgi:serine/threonine protein kinase